MADAPSAPAPSAPPGVLITLKDVYDVQLQMQSQLGSIVEKVPDHEARIRTLERWAYAIPPALLTAIGGLALGLLK